MFFKCNKEIIFFEVKLIFTEFKWLLIGKYIHKTNYTFIFLNSNELGVFKQQQVLCEAAERDINYQLLLPHLNITT